MPEEANQPSDKPKRTRAAQNTRRPGRKRTQQENAASPPAQKAAAPLATPTPAGRTAPQSPPVVEASAQPAPDETPVGVGWGDFPPKERRAELTQRIQVWDQESDHRGLPGPFAGFYLTGADVFWLVAHAEGAGDASVGKKVLDKQAKDPLHFHSKLAGLSGAQLSGAYLKNAQLNGAYLKNAQLNGADLDGAQLNGASLSAAQLNGTDLTLAQLKGASLSWALLEGASLHWAQLEGAELIETQLTNGVDLQGATFDVKTTLYEAYLDATLQVADVVWNGVPLIRLDWGQVPRLGDETVARQAQTSERKRKNNRQRLEGFERASRAYRQLAIALRSRGITQAADRFTYRALIMQRKALWWQMRSISLLAQPPKQNAKQAAQSNPGSRPQRRPFRRGWQLLTGMLAIGQLIGPYLFSWFLAVLTGYGFRMSRIVVAYLLLIFGFAAAYWSVGVHQPRDISFWTALIVSVTAFHGRVFTNPFAPNIPDAQVVITAIEAIVGLVIEGVFIAMLTQRFFNR